MTTDFFYPSQGAGQIHAKLWAPEGQPKAVVQIIHGIAEFIERYDDFANFLVSQGIAVTAEDHMGHGQSIGEGPRGYFEGGWFTAVDDSYQLMKLTMAKFPGVPYILLGHSMGSFMARTILCKYPGSGIAGAIISGTGWQPSFALPALIKVVELMGRRDMTAPNETLQKTIFGGYNSHVEHPRTGSDWLTRDNAVVDAYVADPLCGFTPSSGLFRDMFTGIHYIQKPGSLEVMKKDLPVFFIAGKEDPVGSYGKGVEQAAAAFRKAGMENVSCKLYPLCRHEVLNEINKEEVYSDVLKWMEGIL